MHARLISLAAFLLLVPAASGQFYVRAGVAIGFDNPKIGPITIIRNGEEAQAPDKTFIIISAKIENKNENKSIEADSLPEVTAKVHLIINGKRSLVALQRIVSDKKAKVKGEPEKQTLKPGESLEFSMYFVQPKSGLDSIEEINIYSNKLNGLNPIGVIDGDKIERPKANK